MVLLQSRHVVQIESLQVILRENSNLPQNNLGSPILSSTMRRRQVAQPDRSWRGRGQQQRGLGRRRRRRQCQAGIYRLGGRFRRGGLIGGRLFARRLFYRRLLRCRRGRRANGRRCILGHGSGRCAGGIRIDRAHFAAAVDFDDATAGRRHASRRSCADRSHCRRRPAGGEFRV